MVTRDAMGLELASRARGILLACCVICALAPACADDDDHARDAGVDAGVLVEPVFPEDFESYYQEMRDCRHSHEHDLRFIRVLVSPSAQPSYAALSPDTPYPAGATLVKLEYDEAGCVEPTEYTAMQKLTAGENPNGGDWRWQRVNLEREVIEDGAPKRCLSCHGLHCAPPYGYDLTCAEEL